MTTDPLEGVDAYGHITTGADRTRIGAPFERVVADCAATLRDTLGAGLHGLYVYGSVATGQATPRRSDLDLYAVVADDAANARCTALATELSERHRDVVRDVGIARITLEQLFADGDTGHADRCFLRHYCVNIAGTDLRPRLPACRPTPAVAREFVGDLAGTVEKFRQRLADGDDVAGNVARKLLRSAAVHFSVENGGWSTAGRTGADLIAARTPRYAATVETILPWSQPSPDGQPADEVRAVLDGLGGWLVRRISTSYQPVDDSDPEQLTRDLTDFLTGSDWPFHSGGRPDAALIAGRVRDGYYRGPSARTFWIVVDGARAGLVRLHDLDDGDPIFDLRISKAMRGRGVGSAAVEWLTGYLFTEFPDINRIEGQTRQDNHAMRRIFRRNGYVREAHYREAWPGHDGTPHDSVGYAILRRDWRSGAVTQPAWDE